MVDRNDKNEIEDFLLEYRAKIDDFKNDAYSVLQQCYNKIGFHKNIDDFFVDIAKKLEALKRFSLYNQKIECLRSARKDCRDTFYRYTQFNEYSRDEFDPFYNKIEEIISVLKDYDKDIIRQLEVC